MPLGGLFGAFFLLVGDPRRVIGRFSLLNTLVTSTCRGLEGSEKSGFLGGVKNGGFSGGRIMGKSGFWGFSTILVIFGVSPREP